MTFSVLDNCEHLLDSVADMTTSLLSACPQLTLLTTTREPIGVAGEVIYRVPSLSLKDEAIELFTDRARAHGRAWPSPMRTQEPSQRSVTASTACPLAIELAAARVRALSLDEIARRFAGSVSGC